MTDWNKLTNNAMQYGAELDEHPENLADLALLAAKFPDLDPLNLIFLYLQCPQAQHLRPAASWMNERTPLKNGQWIIRLYKAVSEIQFMRNGRYISISESTPEERYQLQTGKLKSRKKSRPAPMAFFDITQTRLSPEEYKPYLTTAFSEQTPEKLREALLQYARNLNLGVCSYQFSSALTRSRFLPESREVQLSHALSPEEQIPALLHELAAATLILTSTDKTIPQVREFEIEVLYAGLCHQCGLELDAPFQQNLRGICKRINSDDIELDRSFLRIGKALHYTVQNIGAASKQLESKMEEAPKAERITRNFLQEL